MSIYAQAIMSTADALTGASVDAAYDAAYGTYYKAYSGMLNAANAKVAAEANIAAIKEDQVSTDTVTRMKASSAKAQAKVAAALSGSEGGSVDAQQYNIGTNSSLQIANNRKAMEQQVENQLANVYSAQSTTLAIDDPQVEDIDPFTQAFDAVVGSMSEGEVGSIMSNASNMFKQSNSDVDLNNQSVDYVDTGMGSYA